MEKKKDTFVKRLKQRFNFLSKKKKILTICIVVIILLSLIAIPTTNILMRSNSVDNKNNIQKTKDKEKSKSKKDDNNKIKEEKEDSEEETESQTSNSTEDSNKDGKHSSDNSKTNGNSSSTTSNSSSHKESVSNGSNSGNTESNNSNVNSNPTPSTTPPQPSERELLQQQLANGGHSWDFSTESEARTEVSSWSNRGFVAGYGWETVGSLSAYYVYVSTPVMGEDCGRTAHTVNWRNTSKSIDAIDYLVQTLHYSCSGRCSRTKCY